MMTDRELARFRVAAQKKAPGPPARVQGQRERDRRLRQLVRQGKIQP